MAGRTWILVAGPPTLTELEPAAGVRSWRADFPNGGWLLIAAPPGEQAIEAEIRRLATHWHVDQLAQLIRERA